MKDNEKLYKVYHRSYKGIEELYEDLSDEILNISLKNNKIIIHRTTDTLEIERSPYGYCTYLNGEKENEEREDQDIFFYALKFVHKQEKGLTALEICDTNIIDINKSGITYSDEFGKTHFLNFSICAANGPSKSCVAENDIVMRYFKFYTSEVPIKIIFATPFVFKKRNRFLSGGRIKRFISLQQAIINSGYTTYDCS